jgi:hypothetical protein
MASPLRKPSTEDLQRQQRDQKLDELQRAAEERLKKSQRFKARFKRLTGQRLAATEQDLLDTPDPDDDLDLLGIQPA